MISEQRIRDALAAGPSEETEDWSWSVTEIDNECWATGPIHPVDGTADLAKIDCNFSRACNPRAIRELLAELDGLRNQQRLAELEAREYRLLTIEEVNQVYEERGSWHHEALQRKFAEVNGLKVKP